MKAKINKAKLGFLLAFILILSFGSQAFAATVTFDGSTDNDWNDGTNWDTGNIPTANDDVIIPDGFSVALDVNAVALTVTINGTSSLNMTGFTLIVAQNGTGHVTVNSTSATALIGGATGLTIGSATYRGDLVNNSTGTINLTGTPTVISGVITNNAGGNITTTAATDLTLNGTTSVSLPSDIQDLQAFVVNKTGASVTMNADLTMGTDLTITSGTLIVGDNDLNVTANTVVQSGTLLNGSASSNTYTRIFGGTLDLNGTATVNLNVATNTFTGAVTLSADAAPGSTLNLTSSVSAIDGAFASGAAASLNLNGADATFDAGVNFANTTANTNANTVLAFTTSATNTALPTSITELLSLTLNRTAVGNTLTLTNNLTIYNGLTIAIGTVDLATFDLTVSGAFAVTTATGILTADGSTVTFNGPADFGGAAADFSSDAVTNIVFNGSGAISNFPNGPGILVNQFTYNRTGETLILDIGGTLANTGAATPAINITSGGFKFSDP